MMIKQKYSVYKNLSLFKEGARENICTFDRRGDRKVVETE